MQIAVSKATILQLTSHNTDAEIKLKYYVHYTSVHVRRWFFLQFFWNQFLICISIAENSVKPKLALVRFCNGVSDISSTTLSCSVMLCVLLTELLIYYL